MGKQDFTILELGKQNILSFENYLPEEKPELIRNKNVTALGLLTEDNMACGALMFSAYPEEGTAYIDSICVDETLRGQGFGRMLFEAFENRCELMGIKELGARIVIPAYDDAMNFLFAMGFENAIQAERFYEFSKDEIMTWLKDPKTESVRKKLLKDNKKIGESVAKLSSDLRKKLPQIPYDPKLSFAVLGKESKNYCLADKDDDGNIIILKSKLDMNDSPGYFLFLEYVMANYVKDLTDSTKLYITVSTDRIAEIIESLSFLSEFTFSSTIYLAKTIGEEIPEGFEIPYGAFLVPRINGISKMLSDFGYEHSVLYEAYNSSIHILREKDKQDVYLQYELSDTENADGYELSIITGFYKPGLTQEELERISRWKEESAMCSFTEDEKRIFVRAVIVESAGLVTPELLQTVLDGFMAEVDNLCGIDQLAIAE